MEPVQPQEGAYGTPLEQLPALAPRGGSGEALPVCADHGGLKGARVETAPWASN